MLNNISRTRLAGAWFAAIIVIFACSVVVGGAAMTISAAELWLVACFAPPAVMLLVWRGAPPPMVAELLYAADNPSKEGQA